MKIENLLELNGNSYILITVYDQERDKVVCCCQKHELDRCVFDLVVKEWYIENDGIIVVSVKQFA